MQKQRIQSNQVIEIRKVNLYPGDLDLKPSFPDLLTVGTHLQPTLSYLAGYNPNGSQSVHVSRDNELKVTSTEANLDTFTRITNAAPVAFGNPHEILLSKIYPSWYILAESGDLEIRFRLRDGSTWSDEIVIPQGMISMLFKATGIQVRQRAGVPADYYIAAFGES